MRNAIVAAGNSVPRDALQAPSIEPATLAAVLAKEAMYNAACCAAYELYDYITFKQWMDDALLPELSVVRSCSAGPAHSRVLADGSAPSESNADTYDSDMPALPGTGKA